MSVSFLSQALKALQDMSLSSPCSPPLSSRHSKAIPVQAFEVCLYTVSCSFTCIYDTMHLLWIFFCITGDSLTQHFYVQDKFPFGDSKVYCAFELTLIFSLFYNLFTIQFKGEHDFDLKKALLSTAANQNREVSKHQLLVLCSFLSQPINSAFTYAHVDIWLKQDVMHQSEVLLLCGVFSVLLVK